MTQAIDADAAAALLRAYDAQLRARVPARSPLLGLVFERDGQVVRAHHGVCGRVDHPDLGDVRRTDLDALISRQQAAFADRGEPVEWRVHGHDRAVELPGRLLAAGFTADEPEFVMVGRTADLAKERPALPPGVTLREPGGAGPNGYLERLAGLGPVLPRARGDLPGYLRERQGGWNDEPRVCVLEEDGRVVGGGWLRWEDGLPTGMRFAVLEGGVVHPRWRRRGLYRALTAHRAQRARWTGVPYLVAACHESSRPVLERLGFTALTTTTAYRWQPPSLRSRPVDDLPDDVRTRFEERFDFLPCAQRRAEIIEPVPSVTWRLDAADADAGGTALEEIVRRGLLACTPPGDLVYYLDWQHPGYRFDPRRVARPGAPPWPGTAHHHEDHHAYLAPDLSFGTYADPHENSLCVFGAALLAATEDALHALLGTTLRRDGRNVAGHWRFE